jgi:hypothetical protein
MVSRKHRIDWSLVVCMLLAIALAVHAVVNGALSAADCIALHGHLEPRSIGHWTVASVCIDANGQLVH